MNWNRQLSLPWAISTFLGRKVAAGKETTQTLPVYGSIFVWKHGWRVQMIRHLRARRYLLRLAPDGVARLVVPRAGNRAEALRFLGAHEAWLQKRFQDWQSRQQPWVNGRKFQLRGIAVVLRVERAHTGAVLRFGDEIVLAAPAEDYREAVHARLRAIATRELTARTKELAREHGIELRRITVRAQKTRWGSCSSRGIISLNWKLICAPPMVQDYLIVHELMHRHEMNHSSRFWKRVLTAFPKYREAETWLKTTRLDDLG